MEDILKNEIFKRIDKNDINGVKPHIIQHFKSLEGEGGNNAIGITTLFLRLNKCNCSCHFCDTAFSIKGDEKYNMCRADNDELVKMLMENYTDEDRKHIHSCSITGGEPLLHLESFEEIILKIKEGFPNIDHIIFETNGNILVHKDSTLMFLELAARFRDRISFTLSISPKLDGRISYAKKIDNDTILKVYDKVFSNYKTYLKGLVEIQCKFVHSETLRLDNEKLMNLIIAENYIVPRTKILIMPFTPPVHSKTFAEDWNESKNDAAKYALKHYLRYSPRIHIDRGME